MGEVFSFEGHLQSRVTKVGASTHADDHGIEVVEIVRPNGPLKGVRFVGEVVDNPELITDGDDGVVYGVDGGVWCERGPVTRNVVQLHDAIETSVRPSHTQQHPHAV